MPPLMSGVRCVMNLTLINPNLTRMRKLTTVRGFFFDDQLSPNQFTDVTMAELKLELLREEARERVSHTPLPKVSPGGLFQKAIEIEDRR